MDNVDERRFVYQLQKKQAIFKEIIKGNKFLYNKETAMPNILEIDKDIYNALVESFGEDTLKEKIDDILLSAMESRLDNYNREILKFEERYGLSFKEFERMWDEGKIDNKYSYEVEGDFIDWEMMEMEKKELLYALSRLKGLNK